MIEIKEEFETIHFSNNLSAIDQADQLGQEEEE